MPAQKRSYENPPDEDDYLQHNQNHEEQVEDDDESDGSPSYPGGDNEFVIVKLAEVRKEVQCPICLGIIRKTRTVMECLHRFCRECIDKSMRLGNNECPACRTHCASRRSLRDDPNYDALIAALYPNIDKYEEEEFALQEDEKTRNRQIQASITQTFQRQSEALGRRRATARATAAAFVRRSQANYRHLRGRRNHRAAEFQGSDDDEDANGNDGGKDSSSADERCPEIKSKRCKRWGGAQFCQPSSATADGGCDETDLEVNRESFSASAGLVGNSEMLAWGKGGTRSHTRHGSLSGGNGKNARNSRLSKLMEFLRNLRENNDELDIHLKLVSLDQQSIPSLQQSYFCCRPTLSVKQLCQYVALQTPLQAENIELLVVKELPSELNLSISANVSISKSSAVDPCKDELHVLDEEETLVGLKAKCSFSGGYLLLAYRQKSTGHESS